MLTRSPSLVISTAIVALVLACAWPRYAASQPADDGRKRFDDSIVKLPPGFHPNTELNKAQRKEILEVHFALAGNNMDELQGRVARGEVLSPQEMSKYSGSKDHEDDLVNWLKQNGYEILQRSSDHTSVYATSSVANIQKTLGVRVAKVTYKGTRHLAAVTPPSLPRNIGDHVIAIEGLQPFVRAVKHVVTREEYLSQANKKAPNSLAPPPPKASSTESAAKASSSESAPASASKANSSESAAKASSSGAAKASSSGSALKSHATHASNETQAAATFRVKDILKAYRANDLGGATGRGQIIAVLIDAFPNETDLTSFWKQNAISRPPTVTLIKMPRATLPLADGEETLDTEWVSGLAPGAETRVYATGSLQFEDIDKALERIYVDAQTTPGLQRISISLGLREDLVSVGEIKVEHDLFVKLAAIGVTVFMASGDAGSNPDQTGHSRCDDVNVEYMSSDPATIAVGGTSLHVNSAGDVQSEVGWGDSGGGVSKCFPRPEWQRAASGININGRMVPDVSAVADPDPGAFVILSDKEWPVGGTSWSAPIWAGIHALLVEACQLQGKSLRGFLAPKLYKLTSGKGLRDVVLGDNGAFKAGPGWDAVTGLGVPDARELLNSLCATGDTQPK
jgi:kumamolisin